MFSVQVLRSDRAAAAAAAAAVAAAATEGSGYWFESTVLRGLGNVVSCHLGAEALAGKAAMCSV